MKCNYINVNYILGFQSELKNQTQDFRRSTMTNFSIDATIDYAFAIEALKQHLYNRWNCDGWSYPEEEDEYYDCKAIVESYELESLGYIIKRDKFGRAL